jgi:hypothetical protein
MARLKTVSRQSALSTYSATNIDTITQTAIESYLRSFFNEDGANRELLGQFAPELLQYNADPHYVGNDSTKKKLTIARYEERLAAHPPCIVLNTTGTTLKTPGFGRSTHQSRPQTDLIAHHISVFRDIQASIFTAASSRSDLVTLSQAISTIFYDISTFVNGKTLRPQNATDTWLIRLPLQMDAGGTDKQAQGEDPQMQIWTNVFSFTLSFEDSFMLSSEDMKYTVSVGTTDAVNMVFPSSARVGKSFVGTLSNKQVGMSLTLSDYNLATITPGSLPCEYIIHPKRPGVLELRVIQGAVPNGSLEDQGSSIQPRIVAVHPITITF